MNDKFTPVLEKVDLLLLERRQMKSSGPHFKIEHRFRVQGTECAVGEEVAAVYLIHHGREFHIPLSLTLRLLVDFLAKHTRLPQSASQIAVAFRADRFYALHGANAAGRGKLKRKLTRRMARSAIRVYVQRIRRALAVTFCEAHLPLDPSNILVSQTTVTNEVRYRFHGTFRWSHS